MIVVPGSVVGGPRVERSEGPLDDVVVGSISVASVAGAATVVIVVAGPTDEVSVAYPTVASLIESVWEGGVFFGGSKTTKAFS